MPLRHASLVMDNGWLAMANDVTDETCCSNDISMSYHSDNGDGSRSSNNSIIFCHQDDDTCDERQNEIDGNSNALTSNKEKKSLTSIFRQLTGCDNTLFSIDKSRGGIPLDDYDSDNGSCHTRDETEVNSSFSYASTNNIDSDMDSVICFFKTTPPNTASLSIFR